MRPLALISACLAAAPALHAQAPQPDPRRQVFAAESSFAATMAHRDPVAFATFVSPEAVFFNQQEAVRGKAAIVDSWKPLFDGPKPPFSWRPEVVEVLASGNLALTSGPVEDSEGRRVGTFNSIWRREADGSWKVVYDKGCSVCKCEPKE